MIVLAAQNVYMQRAPRRHGEGVEYVREHLRREITDLFALDAQVGHAIGTRANVDNGTRKSLSAARCDDRYSATEIQLQTCLVERSKARAVSANPLDFTQRLLESGAERNRRVLCERRQGLGCPFVPMTVVNGVKLIGCVVVVYPEVAFRLERERHAAVLRKGVVHLCTHTHEPHRYLCECMRQSARFGGERT